MSDKRVELVYFEGCPNAGEARENVRRALKSVDRDATWVERDLTSNTVPARYRGLPSPTVLVDGKDVSESKIETDGSFSCRTGGPPSVEEILSALE